MRHAPLGDSSLLAAAKAANYDVPFSYSYRDWRSASMPTEAIFYVADKLLGGVVSYLVRSGADAVLNRINKQLEEQKEREALRRVIASALSRFEQRYPNLARSFFDETFIQAQGMDQISKLLALSIREVPETNTLARAFSQYFTTPVPNIEEACAHFLLLFQEELEAAPEFAEVVSHRLTRETASNVHDLQPVVDELLVRIKELQTQVAEQTQPVFEARVECFVNNGICNQDRIVIRNVGAPISQLNVEQLLVFKARLYDMQSAAKIVIIRSNGYYRASFPSARAQGDLYSTSPTPHRIRMITLIRMAQMTPINGHLALVDFDRLLRLSYRDSTNAARMFHMKISEFGYSEVSESEFVDLKTASQGALFDFDSMSDEQFIEVLRSDLEAPRP
jgi:hypothetical protein